MMKNLLILSLFFVSQVCLAQTFRISGKVTDKTTGEPLSAVVVFIRTADVNTFTNVEGKYSLQVKQGAYTISSSYIGYEQKDVRIQANKDLTVDFELEGNLELDEVVVSANALDERVKSNQMGMEKLTATEIRRMPALMGEVDIIKAIQLLPGVQATSEGGSGFSVRGGSPDQNLILLDNTTIYNPSHLMGFFSVFNNDVLSGITLYKGDIPLKHGGRLSSLLDIQTKTDMPERIQGTGGIGLISSRLMLEGPIGEKTSWLIGGRRSYADLFLKLSSDENVRSASIYFYDLNAKITHRLTSRDRLELNGYLGVDNFGAEVGSFKYGNGAAALTWGHVYSDKLLSKVSLNLTRYNYGLSSKMEDMEADWKSAITDWMLRVDINQPLSDLWNLSYGTTHALHVFNPGIVTMPGAFQDLQMEGNRALEHSLYLANEQKFSSRFSAKYGLRVSMFRNMGSATVYHYNSDYEDIGSTIYPSGKIYNTYTVAEPRAGLVFNLTEASSLKTNYSHNAQYIQLANNSASGSPLDIWFSAGPNIKPQLVDNFSAGYFHNLHNNAYETSVEIYYKSMNNVIDFAEHSNLILNEKLDGEVRTGKGKAYGVELMVRKNTGKLTGFANYTLSRSERTIPEINKGKTYLAPFDKTHTVNVVANYELSKKISLSAIFIYATGNPTTYPNGRFEINGEYFPIYSGRNEDRRPDYHRLDLSFNFIPKPDTKKRWKGEWNVSLFNAYGKKNPWMITLNQDRDTGRPYAEMIYLFGIVPSITYNVKF
ncbi:MAG: TonB-dependent receptor [Tannerella sp.]|nr:TonB-dependent receptor [Tannerella sp.]